MVFNSLAFLVFFTIFFPVYWIINNKTGLRLRNLFIVAASYLFYGWWDWRFLGLIVLSSAIDFTVGLRLGQTSGKKPRRLLLLISLVSNLGILGFFKYFNFFIESLNKSLSLFNLHLDTGTLNIILPVGISFYTFQTLSYTIDIYKGKLQPTRDIVSFFAFVSFFPQLVAGPIERASHLLGQFTEKKKFSYQLSVEGLRLMLWGFFKKIVIADNLGVLADAVYNPGLTASGLSTIIGTVFFALQIYADFSGYSDIAIGLSRMLGFDLMKNFSTPYYAGSFTEFWRRWHISLSTWFRDYVYIPLGGSRGTKRRVSINLLITFLLSGLWHGANVTFLIWGGLHGFLLILEKQLKINTKSAAYFIIFLFIVTISWIPFRAVDTRQMCELFRSLVDFQSYSLEPLLKIISSFPMARFIALMVILVVFLRIEFSMQLKDFNEWIKGRKRFSRIIIYYMVILAILFIGNFSVKPNFIYFQF